MDGRRSIKRRGVGGILVVQNPPETKEKENRWTGQYILRRPWDNILNRQNTYGHKLLSYQTPLPLLEASSFD